MHRAIGVVFGANDPGFSNGPRNPWDADRFGFFVGYTKESRLQSRARRPGALWELGFDPVWSP